MFIVVLNQTNLVADGQNNKLIYKFPNSVIFKDKFVAVQSIAMFYSWNNISSSQVNNTIVYTWTSGSIINTYTIAIPDGLYDIVALNNLLQFNFINNGTYWISGTQNVYPFEIVVNVNRYAVQLNTYYIPTSLPVGASTPANFVGWPTTSQNSVVTFPANINIILGYTAGFTSAQNIGGSFVASGSYVAKNSANTISYISTTSPQVQPNSNVLFSLSNINNPYSQPSSIIYSLNPAGVGIGELVVDKPPNFAWCKLIDGTYNELRLSFLGTDLKPLVIGDPNMTILLAIRDKDEGWLGTK